MPVILPVILLLNQEKSQHAIRTK